MYDWPECRAQTDADWQQLHHHLTIFGVEAPETLARCNSDIPAVPGGIKDADGQVIAPDPATLDAGAFDVQALWRHPDLLLAQTCWGPLSRGLARYVRVLAQPSYEGIEGGSGQLYSSAIVMRRRAGTAAVPAPSEDAAIIPWTLLENRVFAFNAPDSMSGAMALCEDFQAAGKTSPDLKKNHQTGGHRESVRAVADGVADFASIDCRSWQLALRHDERAAELITVGWTRRRMGLPIITSLMRNEQEVQGITRALDAAGYGISAATTGPQAPC